MKRTLSLLASILLACTAYGQDSLAVSDQIKAEAIVSRLTRELDLQEDQQTSIKAIIDNRFSTLKNKKQTFNAANEQTLVSLRKVLSNEQYNRLLELREERSKQKQAFLKENPGYKFSEEDKQLEF